MAAPGGDMLGALAFQGSEQGGTEMSAGAEGLMQRGALRWGR